MKKILSILHILSKPVHLVSDDLHTRFPWLPHRRQVTHVVVGIVVMYAGASFAHGAGHSQYPVVVDTAGYFFHGVGAAPIIKVIADLLKLEV